MPQVVENTSCDLVNMNSSIIIEETKHRCDRICVVTSHVFQGSTCFLYFKEKTCETQHGETSSQYEQCANICNHYIDSHITTPIFIDNVRNHTHFKPFTKEQEIKFTSFIGSAILNHNMKPIGMLCVLGDFTNKMDTWKLEYVGIMAEQISNSIRLRHAEVLLDLEQQKSDKLQQSKSEFLSCMSHEIRTPINAVIGMSDLLRETSLSKQQAEFCSTISASCTTLLRIVNDILDYSEIEKHTLEIKNAPFSLGETIERGMEQYVPLAEKKDIDFGYVLDPALSNYNLIGDSPRIEQLISYLISNAVKFTESGEIQLDVQLIPAEEFCQLKNQKQEVYGATKRRNSLLKIHQKICAFLANNSDAIDIPVHLLLTVRDTGVGMTVAQCDNLFKPFQQGDVTLTRNHGGTGLGLALCWKLAKLMDGTCWVESKEGKGSTFSVILKLSSRYCAPHLDNAMDWKRKTADSLSLSLNRDESSLCKEKALCALVAMKGSVSSRMISNLLERNQIPTREVNSLAGAMTYLSLSNSSFKICFIDSNLLLELEKPKVFLRQLRRANRNIRIILLYSVHQGHLRKSWLKMVDRTNLRFVKEKSLKDLMTTVSGRGHSVEEIVITHEPKKKKKEKKPEEYKILIVEDNRVNQLVAKRMLSHLGFTDLDIAANGKIGVEKVFAKEYDLVLMDVQMPVMDGIEATKTIRQKKDIAQPYIVSVTANAFQSDIDKCLQAGMNSFVPKPLSLDSLKKLLDNIALCNT